MTQQECPICRDWYDFPEGWENRPLRRSNNVRYVCGKCAAQLPPPESFVSVPTRLVEQAHQNSERMRACRKALQELRHGVNIGGTEGMEHAARAEQMFTKALCAQEENDVEGT
jgi:hypothetical protein